MANDYADVISELRGMQDRIRAVRDRCCDPKSNKNPRYLALSNAVSGLERAVRDIKADLADAPS